MKLKILKLSIIIAIYINTKNNTEKYNTHEIIKKINSGDSFTAEEYTIYSQYMMYSQGKTYQLANLFWILNALIGILATQLNTTISPIITKYIIKQNFIRNIKHPDRIYNFHNIIGYNNIKTQLDDIIKKIKKEKITKKYTKYNSIIFFGPPGCGKTNFAYSIGTEANIPIIKINMADLINENGFIIEKFEILCSALKETVYKKGPCILFFDEFDLMVGNRNNNNNESTKTTIQTFLTKLDETNKELKGVLIIACSNNIYDIDKALLRDGRLGIHILIDKPSIEDIKLFYNQYVKINKNEEEKNIIINQSIGLSCTSLIEKFSKLKD